MPRTAADGPLVAVAALGPFFAVDLHMDGPGWRPLARLAEPDVLRGRVDAARAVIATRFGAPREPVEERATASIVFLGWAARLVSPALGCAVLSSRVPAMADSYWQAGVGAPLPLAMPTPSLVAGGGPTELASLVYARSVVAAVEPLLVAVSATFSVSLTVLWGNVASAIAGAAKSIAATRPDTVELTQQITRPLLSLGPLAGKGAFEAGPGPGSVPAPASDPRPAALPAFVRTTCCLFYRIPGAGYCGDCVLNS